MTRAGTIATLVLLPSVVVAALLTSFEAYRAVDPAAEIFGPPPATSLADAIVHGAPVEQAYPFIRAGQDPNAPVTIASAEFTAGRRVRVSPLMLAVAGREGNVVHMLLNFGARIDLPQNRMAWCLAQQIGNQEVIGILAGDGRKPLLPSCPPARPAATPLLSWVDESP